MKSQQEPFETVSYQAKICRFKDLGVTTTLKWTKIIHLHLNIAHDERTTPTALY